MIKSIDGGKLPERATSGSAGFDVFANEDMWIPAGQTRIVDLGITLDDAFFDCSFPLDVSMLMRNHYLELHPRSSLRVKGLIVGVGIIDLDYRDNIKMVIFNPIREEGMTSSIIGGDYVIKRHDKIGQLILKRHEGNLFPIGTTKDEGRTGGLGSTDKKDNV